MLYDDRYEGGENYRDGPTVYRDEIAAEIIRLDPSLRFEVENLLQNFDLNIFEVVYELDDLYDLVADNEIVYEGEVISPWKSATIDPPLFKEFGLLSQQNQAEEINPSSYVHIKYKIGIFCLNLCNIFRG
jgi:hypothetical protein